MISFPFDSQIVGTDVAGLPIYDRASNSEDLARWFASFFTNGIFANNAFAVTVNGLTVSVASGDCLINGRYGYEPDKRSFSIGGGSSQPRIDSVVLRLDMSLNGRKIDLHIKTGAPASSPVAPSLTRDNLTWELGLANIRIDAGSTSVNQSSVTDTRLDSSRCGIVAQAMKTIPMDTYYTQVQADLAEFKATEQAAFDAWFRSVQTVLDDDVAGNLLNLINEKSTLNTTTIQLTPYGWSGGRQTVNALWVTPYSKKVDVEPAPESYIAYHECVVRCISQGNGTLTFMCEDNPDETLLVNVAVFN